MMWREDSIVRHEKSPNMGDAMKQDSIFRICVCHEWYLKASTQSFHCMIIYNIFPTSRFSSANIVFKLVVYIWTERYCVIFDNLMYNMKAFILPGHFGVRFHTQNFTQKSSLEPQREILNMMPKNYNQWAFFQVSV